MRIISGKFKGTLLHFSQNKNTRPLKDLARESIFNLLTHSNKFSFKLEQSNVLDLYSGTGSFGLECISRQAKNVHFIEKESDIVQILKRNINKLKIKNKTKIFFDDVLESLKKENFCKLKFDLIFIDPPFNKTSIEKLIDLIYKKNLLEKNGIMILHRNKNTKENLHNYFEVVDERVYGISKITFGKFLL